MKLKAKHQKAIRDYGIQNFCRDFDLGVRWLDIIFKGERFGKKPSFGYEYLRKIGKGLKVPIEDLLEE